jgi:hypothetical protein
MTVLTGRAIYQSKGWQQASRWPFIEDNEQHLWAQKEQPQTTRPIDKHEGVIGEGGCDIGEVSLGGEG